MTYEQLMGAVARGWCSTANQHKEMDPELASAITARVWEAMRKDASDRNEVATVIFDRPIP